MTIQLSDHFSYKKLLRFTFPSIIMMIFTSIYGVVDGVFVSNFVGKTPFAAVNFIMPFLMILGAVGFMFGTGGSALIAKTMGENKLQKANELFSLFVYVSFILGIVIAGFSFFLIRPIAQLMGAEGILLDQCVLYGRIVILAVPGFILQMEFQSFFITAEKPNLGLYVTVISGVANMVLDALFMAVFHWGLAGAAAATALSQTLGGVIPLFYFSRKNTSLLRLGKTKFDGKALWKACINGSSELMSNVSMSLVSMLYNIQLIKYAGENGVAAYGVLMYVNMIFLAIFIGYSIGTAPIISYHYGAQNHSELKSLLKKSFRILILASLSMLALSELLARPLSQIFVSYDADLLDLTVRGFTIYSFSFLFAGINIFASSFFTALNNGLISALISFLRTLVFQVASVLLLPLILGIDGIWISIVAAELIACGVSLAFILKKRAVYHY
ncbi:MAG: MATE family efflux transporter [Eubacteriales bacterium]|nr:MATE family efflux transporter [Eubacteriales bacterium]